MSYIDLHAHVLPGTDDGAETLEESLSMLRMASAHGTKTLAVTPHGAGLTRVRYLEKFENLQSVVSQANIPITLVPGMELMADGSFFDRLKSGDVLPIGDGGFILMEFDPLDPPEWCMKAIQAVKSFGYKPLIAHPERYVILQNEPWRAELWAELGAAMQITRSGIFGVFGHKAAETARSLLARGVVSCVASDGHGTSHRRPILDDVNAWLTERFGAARAAEWLCEAPQKILGCAEQKERV